MTTLRPVPYHSDAAPPTRRPGRRVTPPPLPDAPSTHQLKINMHNYTIQSLLATTLLCACSLAAAQSGHGMQDRGVPGDRYGYEMHNGKRDVFTEGANAIGKRDVYTDGAYGIHKPDPYTDGARSAATLNLAGLDRTGVSAPPAHSA